MSDESTIPITHTYSVGCSAEHAFAVYTSRIGEWWDARYTATAETLESVTIEPRIGGRVYATHPDLGEDDWGDTRIVSGDVADEVSALKQEPGQDILVAGSGTLVRTLLAAGLVDELRLAVHHVVLGSGKRLFLDASKTPLKLTDSRAFGSGVNVLAYAAA